MKIISVILLSLSLTSVYVNSQPAYKAKLPRVDANAFYSVELSNEVMDKVRPDLADIRIMDDKGKEVAWLYRDHPEIHHLDEFQSYPYNISTTSKHTDVLITVPSKRLSSFKLKIKNVDVNKEATLLGSDDGGKWFVVKDRFGLNSSSSAEQTEIFLNVNFPLSDYKYYKLSLSDSLSAPLNIIDVGRLVPNNSAPQPTNIVPTQMSYYKAAKGITGIQLVFPLHCNVQRLSFYISSPQYYQRLLTVAEPSNFYLDCILSNETGYRHDVILGVRTKVLKLEIHNGDDQPLTIDSIVAHVARYSLVAELKKGVDYTMTYGDTIVTFPQYDLTFEKYIPDSIGCVMVGEAEEITMPKSLEQPKLPSPWFDFLKTYGIWIVIVIVIVQILWMVRKMLKK